MKTENFSKTKIKICGLRRREDILAVNEANPDYCGFIVEFPKSFRSVTADEVRELVKNLSPEIQPVGVFVNASMELVRSLLDDETLTDKPVIKAFSIKTADDMENALQSPADYILLDQGSGGTGKTFDWSLIPKIERPFFLAGGIGEENLEQAIREIHPFAVDLSSSVETEKWKDPEKIRRVVDIVRKAVQD